MPVTRSSAELRQVLEGLVYLDQNVIDLAARFFAELRSIVATFGEESVERLLPHITSLMTTLDDACKENSLLQREIDSVREDLVSAENKCLDLNKSFKGMTLECCELEDNLEAKTRDLENQLAQYKEENKKLQEAVNKDTDPEVTRLLSESTEQINVLTAERKCLLTTIEVLESEIKCLRAELRSSERNARRRSSSYHDLTSLPSCTCHSQPSQSPTSQSQPIHHTPAPQPTTSPLLPSPLETAKHKPLVDHVKDFNKVLVVGDSHLRYSSFKCSSRGAFIECIPGGKILDIKNVLLSYVGVNLSVIYIHVGCNNLRRGFKGGPGYNGGHGKREALHDMAELLFTARTKFPEATVVLNSVLTRRDIGYGALYNFNSQLELMCNNFGVRFVEANTCVTKSDLVRDGVHFNRRGVSRLGTFLVDNIAEVLRSLSTTNTEDSVGHEAPSPPGLDSATAGASTGDHVPRESLGGPVVSEN